jgi:hypothetical protein
MKTAVEWLYETLWKQNNYSLPSNILEQAKEMEKKQMLNAFQESRLTHPMIGFKHETFVEYYKQFKHTTNESNATL